MPASMESILVDSLQRGTAIGVKLKNNTAVIATAVIGLDTFSHKNKWVEIKPYTLYGYPVKETVIDIRQIESVIPFTVHYDDPVYIRLRELRAKILEIK
jgi:hypothetical protein